MLEFASVLLSLLLLFALQNFPNRCANCFVSNKRNCTGRRCRQKRKGDCRRDASRYDKDLVPFFFSLSNPLTFSLYIYIYIYIYIYTHFKNLIYYSWCSRPACCSYHLRRSEEQWRDRRIWQGQNEGEKGGVYIWLIVRNISQENIRNVRQNLKNGEKQNARNIS